MYLSHKHKLLVLRPPKTAGSSVCEFLIKNLGDDEAIYTPIPDSGIVETISRKVIEKYYNGAEFFHLGLEELYESNVMTREQIENYRIISVIREPLDRQKSIFYYYRAVMTGSSEGDLEDYYNMTPYSAAIHQGGKKIREEQVSFGLFEGRQYADYWLYENIEYEVNKLINDLNIEVEHPLPKHKTQYRAAITDEIQFDDNEINRIRHQYPNDFKTYEILKNK